MATAPCQGSPVAATALHLRGLVLLCKRLDQTLTGEKGAQCVTGSQPRHFNKEKQKPATQIVFWIQHHTLSLNFQRSSCLSFWPVIPSDYLPLLSLPLPASRAFQRSGGWPLRHIITCRLGSQQLDSCKTGSSLVEMHVNNLNKPLGETAQDSQTCRLYEGLSSQGKTHNVY